MSAAPRQSACWILDLAEGNQVQEDARPTVDEAMLGLGELEGRFRSSGQVGDECVVGAPLADGERKIQSFVSLPGSR